MRSHEVRLSRVPPKIELGGDSPHCCPPGQNFGGDSPSLSPMIYATEWKHLQTTGNYKFVK